MPPRRFDFARLPCLVLLAAAVAAPVCCRTVPTSTSSSSSSSFTPQTQQQQAEDFHLSKTSTLESESETAVDIGFYPPAAGEPNSEGVVEHQVSLSRRALLQSTTYPIEVKHQPGLSYRVNAATSRKKKKLQKSSKKKKKSHKGRGGSEKDRKGGKTVKAPKSNRPSKGRGEPQASGSTSAAGKPRPSSTIFLSLPTDDVEIEGDEDEEDKDGDEKDSKKTSRKSRAGQAGAPSFNGADTADLSSSEGIQVIGPNATDSSGGEEWGLGSSNTILAALGVATLITVCCFCICCKLSCGGTPDEASGNSYMLRQESLLARAYLNYSLPSTAPAEHSGHKKKCSKGGQHTKKKKKHHHKHHDHKKHSGKNKQVDPHKRLVAIEEQDIVPNHDHETKSELDGGGVGVDHEAQTVAVEVEATLDMDGEMEKDSKSQPPV